MGAASAFCAGRGFAGSILQEATENPARHLSPCCGVWGASHLHTVKWRTMSRRDRPHTAPAPTAQSPTRTAQILATQAGTSRLSLLIIPHGKCGNGGLSSHGELELGEGCGEPSCDIHTLTQAICILTGTQQTTGRGSRLQGEGDADNSRQVSLPCA